MFLRCLELVHKKNVEKSGNVRSFGWEVKGHNVDRKVDGIQTLEV